MSYVPVILTHRGLDPDQANYFGESTKEAFLDQLTRGYGLEFDLHFTKDDAMPVLHDATLKRFTSGADMRAISEVTFDELQHMPNSGTITTIPDLFEQIAHIQSPGVWSALHLKHMHQNEVEMEKLLRVLTDVDHSLFVIFDVAPQAAIYLKEKDADLRLYASVAHSHDIERYNTAVGGTLISLDELEAHKTLYAGAWLDEWDLADKDGGTKTLYNQKVFDRLRAGGFGIALVTPELHGTSPGLLGGEAHPDAATRELLNTRLADIIALEPDALCTDYPDYVRNLAHH
jgi:glycerophosphoryl diester phosphodiesterase